MRTAMSTVTLLSILILMIVSCTNRRSDQPMMASQSAAQGPSDPTLGLPELEAPMDNPITKEKVALGEKLFNDVRFSKTGTVSCATCHAADKEFTDSPLRVSKGINDLEGTRNAPTVMNAAFNKTQFWDGRSPSLEDQALHPFVNPVEMALDDHKPIIEIIKKDPSYVTAFQQVFKIKPDNIKIDHVTKAIATFERTLIEGNSRFDRWYFKGESTLTDEELKGFQVFVGNGRCVSCHAVEHTSAIFTDHKFHNIGVGINGVPQEDIDRLTEEFLRARYDREQVDKAVLTDPKTSELGRFAVTRELTQIGAFKTSTLRNIEKTAPYMHDGSLKTLEEVVDHYNRGGASSDQERINPYLSGGMRPLDLSDQEIRQLVAFLKALNSPDNMQSGR